MMQYNPPELNIIRFTVQDVIATSGDAGQPTITKNASYNGVNNLGTLNIKDSGLWR